MPGNLTERRTELRNLMLRAYSSLMSLRSNTVDDDGQTLAEYGLIMTLIAIAVVITAAIVFRTALVHAFAAATNCLDGSC